MKTKQTINIEKIKKDFPILKTITYLDSGATSLTPEQVLEAMNNYYRKYRSNVHRGLYKISEEATEAYEGVREKVAQFINAHTKEIIFTKGTTESINLLAYILTKNLKKGDEIVLTEMEHHSNLVPWQQIAKEKDLTLKFIPVTEEGFLETETMNRMITSKTKIVSVTHVSNALGTINDIKTIAKKAHEKNALVVVDGAQSAPHLKIDVKDLDCDFFAFSAHKMLGPTGTGVLYGRRELLEELPPFFHGGEMISEVSFEESSWNELPWKFEAGTPNIAGVIGLGAAIDYLQEIGMETIREHEERLLEYALKELKKINNVIVYGPLNAKNRSGVISFNIQGIHSHDTSTILDRENIAIRAGHLCAMPLIKSVLNEESVCRASFSIYNTKEEIDKLIQGIKKAKEIFKI